MDTPLTSVYIPLYTKVAAVSHVYSTGHNAQFTRDSASWAFNFVNNFMQLNYRDSSQQDVYPAIESWQAKIDEQCKAMEHRDADVLSQWQIQLQAEVVASWWKLADFLVMKYNDGRVNYPTLGQGIGYPQWYANMIGFNNDIHPVWVQPAPQPEKYPLPGYWNGATQVWSDHPSTSELAATADSIVTSSFYSQVATILVAMLIAASTGIVVGRKYEQCRQKAHNTYSLLG